MAMIHRPLTEEVHDRLRTLVGVGDVALDATVGNGHDTVMLAHRVGASGCVHGFDIQPIALQGCRARLAAQGLLDRVVLHDRGHEHMSVSLPTRDHGRVAAVLFNLGYLPGGDKQVVTRPCTTVAALEQAVGLLRAGGVLSVLVYVGHPGGEEELAAVQAWLGARQGLRVCHRSGVSPRSPQLFFMHKDQ